MRLRFSLWESGLELLVGLGMVSSQKAPEGRMSMRETATAAAGKEYRQQPYNNLQQPVTAGYCCLKSLGI
jgi:hypothetical protein